MTDDGLHLNAFVTAVDRENLPYALVGKGTAGTIVERRLSTLVGMPLQAREVIVGRWGSGTDDPFPDFMIVRDEDVNDTYAWLSSYLSGLAPITQWCRIWSASQLPDLLNVRQTPTLDGRLGPWVGAIVAECVAQARMPLNLKSLSGTLALSSASFGAARAQAVWGRFAHFGELARRHDELSERLRARTRPVPAARLANLWNVLVGEAWMGRQPAEARTLGVIREVFATTASEDLPAIERAGQAVQRVTDAFDLPDLAACVAGTQRERVEALDRLGERLRVGPKSPTIDAILGFGASLVEPGAAVMPDLLRRFETAMPTAQIWAGAFAGLWAPVRVMSDHGGLGRLVAKALLRDNDLFARPEADISFDEVVRWLPTGRGDRMPVMRGMNARVVEVELLPGVTSPFQLRPDPVQAAPAADPTRQRALDLQAAEVSRPSAAVSVGDLVAMVDVLAQRITALEAKGTTRRGGARKPKD